MRAGSIAATLVAVGLACAPPAIAADGDLDPTFGSGGRVVTPLGEFVEENAVTIDGEGRIVAVGKATGPSNSDMAVVRYLPTGALDSSFNVDGIATFDFPAANDSDDAFAVTVDAAGGILAAGSSFDGSENRFALIRVSPNGALDTSFGPPGSNGFVRTHLFDGSAYATAMALDAQGRIVLAGRTLNGDLDMGVVRYDSAGELDPSFGAGGIQNVDFCPCAGDQEYANAVAIDAQGRIVLAGRTRIPPSTSSDFALARLNPDGSGDATFGPNLVANQGQVITPMGPGLDEAFGITLDPQGRIVVSGQAVIEDGGNSHFALARYNPDGSLDQTLSEDGKVNTPVRQESSGSDGAHGVGVDSQGRIVVAGRASVSLGANDFAVARYQPNGTLDPTFGAGGVATSANGLGLAVAFDARERIVVAGTVLPGDGTSNSEFGLARFIGDSVPPTIDIGAGPADGALTNDPTPTFEFSSGEATDTFACGFDGASSACSSPATSSAPLSDGKHAFTLTATDRNANSSAATTRTFTVDTEAPDIDITGKKKVKTRKKKAKGKLEIETSEPAALTCAVDTRAPVPCADEYKTPKLKKGKHEVTVTATDQAGNSSDETKKIKVVRKKP